MSTDRERVTVFFNPDCSKCRTVQSILAERDVDADYVRYLEATPSRGDLERVVALLGDDDVRAIVRVDEPIYTELGLGEASPHELLDALLAHPSLIQRPIVIRGNRAVVARPAEKVLDLLD